MGTGPWTVCSHCQVHSCLTGTQCLLKTALMAQVPVHSLMVASSCFQCFDHSKINVWGSGDCPPMGAGTHHDGACGGSSHAQSTTILLLPKVHRTMCGCASTINAPTAIIVSASMLAPIEGKATCRVAPHKKTPKCLFSCSTGQKRGSKVLKMILSTSWE